MRGTYAVNVVFFAAQFVAYFNWSNLGVIFAISGAELLQSIGFTGIPLIVTFVIVASLINLLIGSASACGASGVASERTLQGIKREDPLGRKLLYLPSATMLRLASMGMKVRATTSAASSEITTAIPRSPKA